MFNFSSPSSLPETSTSPSASIPTAIVSPDFWMYWAVTIPLTLVILTVWKFWMVRNKYKKGAKKPLKTERVMQYQKKVKESLNTNTPFYPGKGSTRIQLWGNEENV